MEESEAVLSDNFSHYRVTCVSGNNGKYYITFDKGIAELQLVSTAFVNFLYSASSEEAPHSIRYIYKNSDSLLYTTSYKEGFIRLNEATGEKTKLSGKFVYTLLPWRPGKWLLATEGDGLQWFDTATGLLKPLVSGMNDGDNKLHPPGKYITSLAHENDSMIWAGTYIGAYLVNVYTGEAKRPFTGAMADAFRQAKIYDIQAAGGNRYFSTGNGLFAVQPATGAVIRLPRDADTIYAGISFYNLRRVNNEWWAATNGRGILVMDAHWHLLREINTAGGLAGNEVYSIRQLGNYIIAGTGQGLSVIDIHTGRIHNYSRLDNLPSNEFNHSAVCIYGDRIYMGTINGITQFDTATIAQYNYQARIPALYFTSFIQGNRYGLWSDYTLTYRRPDELDISAGTRFFSLRFGGTDQGVEELNYYYRLSDKEAWQEIGRQHELSFAGMAPGSYRLQVAAALPGKAPFRIMADIRLHVRPAFYQTWWFMLLCIAALLCIVIGIFRYRIKHLLKEQRLRTQIAGDLHDEVGSTLTRIYFQADVLGMQQKDTPLLAPLRKIADTSREALSVMSDMVWSIDARFDTVTDLINRIKDYLNKLQDELDIVCMFELKGKDTSRPLSQVLRQNLYLIFKEAVSNAARYSSDGQLKVVLSFDDTVLALQVSNAASDTVSRFKNYQGGRGMEYMQLRAKKIQGNLQVKRDAAQFVVYLEVPR